MEKKEQPVFGIMYHAGDSDAEGEHSHDMYLITWDGRPLHVHNFAGVTSFDVGHRHRYAGTTQPAPSGVPHTHGYYTITSFDDGHMHVIRGVTGPAIPAPGGGHYHLFEGVTTVSGRIPHTHYYSGRTTASL
ncbi:YmaF family protein [Effusibacillus pohliae]|uniref:YmaF family protein n=1 Tax=Effusibacillus pohliae TaxID=232270 RepID=UPI0003717522|nr:YmaF family protein [Effusibacillus pohliae]